MQYTGIQSNVCRRLCVVTPASGEPAHFIVPPAGAAVPLTVPSLTVPPAGAAVPVQHSAVQ